MYRYQWCTLAIELPKTYIDKNGQERTPSVYFHNYHKQLPLPFVIYADFESITEKIIGCQPSDRKSYTEKYQKHTACSFGYKGVCHYDKKFSKDVVIYRGDDAISKFMKSMFEELNNCQKIMRENFNKPLQMTNRDEEAFIVIFVRENISLLMEKIYLSEITVTLLENIEALLIKLQFEITNISRKD